MRVGGRCYDYTVGHTAPAGRRALLLVDLRRCASCSAHLEALAFCCLAVPFCFTGVHVIHATQQLRVMRRYSTHLQVQYADVVSNSDLLCARAQRARCAALPAPLQTDAICTSPAAQGDLDHTAVGAGSDRKSARRHGEANHANGRGARLARGPIYGGTVTHATWTCHNVETERLRGVQAETQHSVGWTQQRSAACRTAQASSTETRDGRQSAATRCYSWPRTCK